MNRLSDEELWSYIREDIPYFDLTTHLLDLPAQHGKLEIVTREPLLAACTEEAARIAELLGCEVVQSVLSGKTVPAGATLLAFTGEHTRLHEAWRVCQILLEYACAMATYADAMVQSAHGENPNCEVLVTRKSFPFAKRFCIRALLCGGVVPHRLGLSESVLVFDNHRRLYPDKRALAEALQTLMRRCVEKELVVEAESVEDAQWLLAQGVEVLQLDKLTADELAGLVAYAKASYPRARLLAAGGINKENVAQIARSGVDAVVTSRPYQAGMADLTSRWSSL